MGNEVTFSISYTQIFVMISISLVVFLATNWIRIPGRLTKIETEIKSMKDQIRLIYEKVMNYNNKK